MEVFPLIFDPILKPKLWGGRRLEGLVAKNLPPGSIGESWEIVDLAGEQSRVSRGPAAGKNLADLRERWGTSLTGRAPLHEGRFPLLVKFIDAAETLSIQVHPDPEAARRLGGDARPKTEAWYILAADPGAFIYRGLQPGMDVADLRKALDQGRVESVLRRIPARVGHCYLSPAGTVHALGAGIVVAEVQTPSDTTLRLHDWNRTDPATGQPRRLDVEAALDCVRIDETSREAEKPEHLASVWTSVTSLVRCEFFVIERVRMAEGVQQEIPHQEMVIWIVLQGHGIITHDGSASPTSFGVGDTVLIPAGLKRGRVEAKAPSLWLEVTVPIPSSLSGFEPPERTRPLTRDSGAEHFVTLNVPPKS